MKPTAVSPETLSRDWTQQLREGLARMHIDLSDDQRQRLVDYLLLLYKWNRVYNLTAVREPAHMVSRQLLDSLSILPWVEGPRVLDVGCGAGLPGIPLAIALPDLQFTLLDANGKKTRFVQQVAGELGLGNVTVVQARVEQLQDDAGFNTITSRAFAELHQMIDLTAHLLARGGRWAAMKAGLEELDESRLPPGTRCAAHELQVPGESGVRHLVLVSQDA